MISIVFALFLAGALGQSSCKLTPSDVSWPSIDEWNALNETINGTLIQTRPAASSCYDGNPFNSSLSCDFVESNWTTSAFHAALPESVDYPIFANNSCLPPGATGYNETLLGCYISGFPLFVVNATDAEQISTAVAWAAVRDIRVVVKGTGHDLNGRCVSVVLSPNANGQKDQVANQYWRTDLRALLHSRYGRTTSRVSSIKVDGNSLAAVPMMSS